MRLGRIVEIPPHAIADRYPGLTSGDVFHVMGWHSEFKPLCCGRPDPNAKKPEGWIRMVNKAKKDIQSANLRILQSELSATWEAEVKFHPDRRWRFDFADWASMVAIEIEGGVFVRGRHSRGKGMIADMEKYNAATSMGWRVFRVTPGQFGSEAMFSDVLLLLRNDELRKANNADQEGEAGTAA